MEISEALEALDKDNDEHWTADGTPSLDYVRELTGNTAATRQEIVNADPTFTREGLVRKQDPQPTDEPTEPTEQETADALTQIDLDISAAEKEIAEFQRVRDQLLYKRKVIYQKHHVEYDQKADTNRRVNYLKKQHERQVEKEMRRRQVFKKLQGEISPADIDPRTPLDQAMERKTARGTGRPTRPLINNPGG